MSTISFLLCRVSSLVALFSLFMAVSATESSSEVIASIEAAALKHNQTIPMSLEEAGLELVLIPDEVKNSIPLPSWLDSWEDAEFAGKIGMYGVPYLGDSENLTVSAAAYLFSMTSGTWIDNSMKLQRRDDEEKFVSDILAYMETGNYSLDEDLEKRAWQCFRNRGAWHSSAKNVARISALNVLGDVISGTCTWISLNRSAICGQDGVGNQACVSWSGGWQGVLGCVAKAVLDSAAGSFAEYNNDYSGWYDDALLNYSKRSVWVDEACVSNRPNGCGSTYHQGTVNKRYNWDDDAHGWCAANNVDY